MISDNTNNKTTMTTTIKQPCPYGVKCYRVCKNHFEEFSHTEEFLEINRKYYSISLEKKRYYYNSWILRNKVKLLTQWDITKSKWLVDKNYKDPHLGFSRNDFGISGDDGLHDPNIVCCFKVYLNMYRHHYEVVLD